MSVAKSRGWVVPWLVLAFGTLGTSTAGSAPAIGNLDSGYGAGGAGVVEGTAIRDDCHDDGRVLALQWRNDSAGRLHATLRQYDPEGRPDPAWGRDGVVEVDVPAPAGVEHSWFDFLAHAVRAEDGRIYLVVPGNRRSVADGAADSIYGVVRLHRDGTLDRAYGAAGLSVLPRPVPEVRAEPWAAPDGSLLLGVGADFANDGYGASSPAAVRRLDASGRLDTGFGGAGEVEMPRFSGQFIGIAAQADGRVTVVLDVAILRLQGDGSPDRSFGEAGTLAVFERVRSLLGFAARLSREPPPVVQEALFDRDGGLVLALGYGDGTRVAAGLLRLDANGLVAPGFGTAGNGYVPLDLPRYSSADAPVVAVTTLLRRARDGQLVVMATVGSRSAFTDFESIAMDADGVGLLRLRPDGRPDTRFGIDGGTLLSLDSRVRLLAAQARGAAIVGFDGRLRRSAADPGEAPGLVSVLQNPSIVEEAGSARVPVLRAGGSQGVVALEYTTVDGVPIPSGAGGALAGSDYVATTGRVAWADGETGIKFITVPLVDDAVQESYEYFRIRWRPVAGAAVLVGGDEMTTGIVLRAGDVPVGAAPPASRADSGGGGGGALDATCLLALLLSCCRAWRESWPTRLKTRSRAALAVRRG